MNATPFHLVCAARYSVEMKCPACGDTESYTGLQWVHCKNTKCTYYDARYAEKLREERAASVKRFEASLNDKAERLIRIREKLDSLPPPPRL